MPVKLLTPLVRMQPALRHRDEMFTARLQVVWCPVDEDYTVSVTVLEGVDQDELRSLVVLHPQRLPGARLDLYRGTLAILELLRRTTDPFDDLL